MDRRLWHGTQHSNLLLLIPHFFHSMLTCHATQHGIAEHQNSRSEITRKIRRQAGAGSARGDGASAAAAPAGARGEPMAAAPPAVGAAGVWNALGDLGVYAEWIGAYGWAHSIRPSPP